MSCDALFQLGMGPVRLEAPQTEDCFAMHGRKRCVRVFRALFSRVRSLLPADQARTTMRQDQGNSAKARLHLAGSAAGASNT